MSRSEDLATRRVMLARRLSAPSATRYVPVAFVCACCGRTILTPFGTCGTGYGVTSSGTYRCYVCCGVHERAAMMREGRAVLYLTRQTSGTWTVGDWTGQVRFPTFGAPRKSRVGGCVDAERMDAWFAGPDGFVWHAVQRGDMDLCRARRTKERVGRQVTSQRGVC